MFFDKLMCGCGKGLNCVMVTMGEYENEGDLRLKMVSDQLVRRGIHNPIILNAFRDIPRHLFVSNRQHADAYSDNPLPIKCGQTISQPYVVALMLNYLDIQPSAHILEIGSGSGYATALMSRMCSHICAIEVYQDLIDASLRVLRALQISNFEMHHASAWEQLSGATVYDRIILWASPPRIPEHLFEYLKEGGILVAPEGKSEQDVWICTKKDGKMIRQRKDPVSFVPLVQGSIQEIDRNLGGKHE